MNGDWIALDTEDDVCCAENGNGCTCELEFAHIAYINKNGFRCTNFIWCIDEYNWEVTSKVAIQDSPDIHILQTTLIDKDTYKHEFVS